MVLAEAKQNTVILDGKEISLEELNQLQESVTSGKKIKEIIPEKEYRTVQRLLD